MGFPWKAVFSVGLSALAGSGHGKAAGRIGSIVDVLTSAVHDVEHQSGTGAEKLIAVEARTLQAINDVANAAGKSNVVDDELRELIIAATNANVALENGVAKRLKD
jgi:flagellar hook-basal body complex protein FliE